MPHVHPLKQFLTRESESSASPYLHQPYSGDWKTFTWSEVGEQARRIASGLLAQGYKEGDRIAILAKNSMEWIVADVAIAMAGMISVPIYATAGEETISYVLEHGDCKAIFLGKLDDYEPIDKVDSAIPKIGFPYPEVQTDIKWNDWLKEYSPLNDVHQPSIDDTYSIVYTSGSTGKPKGVVLTGRNLAVGANAMRANLPDGSNRILSYLPMAHITERCLVTMLSLYAEMEVFFNESLATFVNDLHHVKPTVFVTVPRLWSKFQSQILQGVPDKKLQRILSVPIVGNAFAKRIRQKLGFGSCTTYGSGTAPISPSVLAWWGRLGVNIEEGWGMTELSGAGLGNSPFNKSFLGSVGVPLEGFEFKLSEEEELLVKGDGVFKEYYKNPEETAKSFDDGWFKTGDKAKLESSGAWSITGRIKEQFKTAKGKYVTPTKIENLLKENTNIEQSCVVGSGLPQPIALIALGENPQEKAVLEESLNDTLIAINEKLESHERVSRIVISKEPWSIENDLLTPTLKLKRDNIEAHYQQTVAKEESAKVVWED